MVVYLLTNLIQNKQITIKGAGKNVLKGALVGVGLGDLGRGIKQRQNNGNVLLKEILLITLKSFLQS